MSGSWVNEVVSYARVRPAVVRRRERPLMNMMESIRATGSAGLNPIIAELKLASPSGFRSERDPQEYLKSVKGLGACAVSVLTEPVYFKGSYQNIELAGRLLDIPVLMKDFVVSRSQILTGFSLGADSVLLIVRILTDEELADLYSFARLLGMQPLVEVHDEEDLARAEPLRPELVGVNARDLLTLRMNRERQKRILRMIGWNAIKVAESGIKGPEDIADLKGAGADAFLIGTALMEEPEALKKLLRA